ncbi:urease accessory protein UreH [Halobacillus litoralis]|uniref:Urease accessory protein UreH n=1 Tax=Halobacillus litoralis TaxID=45668 RepID=A0A845E772_9BACI|nr:sulfite exporter TauE/SafE family protein [Halobacillus litoralis]MYL21534.1 urease accessory protein UreH [Halobacillus litoralis]MYL37526.1 urease accessory protein UreH [Halobacillus litoralis]
MEDMSLLAVLGLGLALGIKHALEPDHVIAVSTSAAKSRKVLQSAMTGIYWGIGHTLTMFVFGMAVILMQEQIPETWAQSLEALVGVMLILVGATTFLSYKKSSSKQEGRSYKTSVFMGIVHGLAGSAALVLLTLSSVESAAEGAAFIFIFGAGTIVGMLLFTTVIGLPFVLTTKKWTINKGLTQAAGIISAVYGVYYLSSIYFG